MPASLLLTAKKNGKNCIIDSSGNIVIRPTDDYLLKPSDGMVWFLRDDKFGLLNSEGKVVVKPTYVEGEPFSDGLACVATKEDDDGYKYYTVIDRTGKQQFKPRMLNEAFHFQDGLAWVITPKGSHNIDRFGKRIPKDPSIWTSYFREGLASFSAKNGLNGYIDSNGKVVIKPAYSNAGGFEGGVAPVRIGGSLGEYPAGSNCFTTVGGTLALIDRNGYAFFKYSVKGTAGFELFNPLSEGFVTLRQDGLYGYMRLDQSWLIEPKFDTATAFKQGLAVVKQKEKEFIIDTKGRQVISQKYSQIQRLPGAYFKVWHGGTPNRREVIDLQGRPVCAGKGFHAVDLMSENVFEVEFSDKTKGYARLDGTIIWKNS